MVKLQKPLPKKFKEKPKLDNPIKKQKDGLKKNKAMSSTKNISKKLLAEEIPAKKSLLVSKPAKSDVQTSVDGKKVNKKQKILQANPNELETNGSSKAAKKSMLSKQNGSAMPAPLIMAPKVEEKKPTIAKNVGDKPKQSVKLEKSKKKVLAPKPPVSKEPPAPKAPIADAAVKKGLPPKVQVAPTKGKKKNAKAPVLAEEPEVKKTTPAAKVLNVKVAEEKVPKEGKKNVVKTPASAEEETDTVAKPGKKITKPIGKKGHKIASKKVDQEPTAVEEENDEEKPENEKSETERPIYRYKPFPYDEERFDSIVTKENVIEIVEALKTVVQKQIASKKKAIFDDFRYMLQVGCFKIPSCPKRMVKLFLRHPMVQKGDDVLFIVPDLKRGAKVDYEPTKQHYEDLLKPIGLDWLTVMPMNQLRKECVTFEQKRRLIASYDYFLCDGRIVSHVVGLIGKLTQKSRVTLHAVRRSGPENLKTDIEKAMNKTAYRQLCKSTLYTIPLATHRFTSEQVADNVIKVVKKLKKIFPGGMGNVRNLYMKIDIVGTSALPLYVSMAKPPEETPYVVGPREKRMLEMKKEANEVLSKFAMTKEGKLIKLNKAGVEKKRKLMEMRAALKEEEDGEPKSKKSKKAKNAEKDGQEVQAKAAKKDDEDEAQKSSKVAKKASTEAKKKQKKGEVNELELPENEEDDEETSDEDDDDEHQVQLAGSSDEEESEDMGQFDQEEDDDQESLDAESDIEILENGLADEDDEESEDEQQEDANTSDGDEDDDDEGDDDDDGDEDEDEEDDDDESD